MNITVTEARARLALVQSAIDDILAGTRRKSLKIGTSEFMRAHEFETLSYRELKEEEAALLDYINTLEAVTVTPTFRQNTHIPLIITKTPE
jgi:hypothetical protein